MVVLRLILILTVHITATQGYYTACCQMQFLQNIY